MVVSQLILTLPDGSTRTVDAGTLPIEVVRGIGERLARDAIAVDSLDKCGIYFGTTGGQVYASADGGDSWAAVVRDLPAVLSVEVQTLP